MKKSTAARAAAFIGALGASAALVGAAVSTTGAYFTDSQSGDINAGTGSVKLNTTDRTLNFDNLLPGEYKTQTVNYNTGGGTGKQDLWLVFPDDGSSDAFTSTPKQGPVPLGRYGHLKITSSAGAYFVSNNLSKNPAGYDDSASCSTNTNGHGGSAQEAQNRDDKTVPYCAPRNAILLQSNMNPGDQGSVSVEFGFTKILNVGQGQPRALLAKYKIVATQHGIRPDDPNN